MTRRRLDLGGAVVADSSGRPGDDAADRRVPPHPDDIAADPGGRGLGLSAGRPEDGFGQRSGPPQPGSLGRRGPGGGTEDAAVRNPHSQVPPLDRPDTIKTERASHDQ